MSEPLLRTESLRKAFPMGDSEISVLDGIDLRIDRGERVAIVGQSGVGKSTLLHILGTLDRPTSGRVWIEGEDVFEKDPAALAGLRNRAIGFVFQFHHLLPEFNSLENVMMPGLIAGESREAVRERSVDLLEDVGLGHRLEQPVTKLSGGERQRVALARALVQDPPLVLADEPTGNLDPSTGDEMTDLLLEMNRSRGTTLVVVTHSAAMASKLGRVVRIENGQLPASESLPSSARDSS